MKLGQQSGMATAGQVEMARLAWLALVLTPGMGATRTQKAMRRLGEPERLFGASLTELEGLGLPSESAQFCFSGRARRAAEEEMSRVVEAGGSILTPSDETYPEPLRQIYDPPAV